MRLSPIRRHMRDFMWVLVTCHTKRHTTVVEAPQLYILACFVGFLCQTLCLGGGRARGVSHLTISAMQSWRDQPLPSSSTSYTSNPIRQKLTSLLVISDVAVVTAGGIWVGVITLLVSVIVRFTICQVLPCYQGVAIIRSYCTWYAGKLSCSTMWLHAAGRDCQVGGCERCPLL